MRGGIPVVYERKRNSEIYSRQVLTVRDAAKYLDIGVNKCYAIVRSGELKSFKIGKAIRITKNALENYCNGTS